MSRIGKSIETESSTLLVCLEVVGSVRITANGWEVSWKGDKIF
jgi:hypothetical protein